MTDCRLEGDRVIAAETRSIIPARADQDALPPELQVATKPPEVVAAEMLRAASQRNGWRLVVTPPEKHPEIGRSVAKAIGATFVSFEEELLKRMEPEFAKFERAERFKAQRPKLKAAAEALLDELVKSYGGPGKAVVLGDTGILGLCEATHLPQRLYSRATGENIGFWAVVVPGVISKRQPLFNERTPVFHLDSSTIPLASTMVSLTAI
jgi:hypothetical protein